MVICNSFFKLPEGSVQKTHGDDICGSTESHVDDRYIMMNHIDSYCANDLWQASKQWAKTWLPVKHLARSVAEFWRSLVGTFQSVYIDLGRNLAWKMSS